MFFIAVLYFIRGFQCVIKQLLNWVIRDIQNYQGLGNCYQPQPSALADNTDLALDNSG